MAKTSSFSNMVITLFGITLVSSAILGTVYTLTEEPIRKAETDKINKAIAEVVPAFDNSPSTETDTVEVDHQKMVGYRAKKDGQLVGIAIQANTSKGFGGLISLMVGFLPDGTIHSTAVIKHAETPGLGDKIDKTKSTFSTQFEGKHPDTFKLAVKKDGGDVDAITASTISSRAFCDAIERAGKAFKEMNKEK
jgi:electron transport complex protein RnfG